MIKEAEVGDIIVVGNCPDAACSNSAAGTTIQLIGPNGEEVVIPIKDIQALVDAIHFVVS